MRFVPPQIYLSFWFTQTTVWSSRMINVFFLIFWKKKMLKSNKVACNHNLFLLIKFFVLFLWLLIILKWTSNGQHSTRTSSDTYNKKRTWITFYTVFVLICFKSFLRFFFDKSFLVFKAFCIASTYDLFVNTLKLLCSVPFQLFPVLWALRKS